MQNMTRVLVGLGCLGAATSYVSATVLFSDDFEGASATPYTITQQINDPSLVTDSDPLNTTGTPYAAEPGQWFHYAKTNTPAMDIQVTTNQDFPSNGAATYQGTNFLRIHRTGGQAAIGAHFADQSSGLIKATWLMMVPDQKPQFINFQAGIYMTPYADNDSHGIGIGGEGLDGSRGTMFTLNTYETDPPLWARIYENQLGTRHEQVLQGAMLDSTWQQYEMLLNLTTQTWQLSVADVDGANKVSSGTFGFNIAGSLVNTLTFRGAQEGATYFIDQLKIEKLDPRWKVDQDGLWSDPNNWELAVPNGVGDVANFTDAISDARTVTVDGAKTVGTINFENLHSYTLAGTGTITMDVGAGTAGINVVSGSHTIAAPLVMNRATQVDVAAGSTLNVMGGLTANATGDYLTKSNAGTMVVNHVRVNGLNINGGVLQVSAKATANDPAGTSTIKPLAIAGGPSAPTAKLDLTNNSMAVDYTAVDPINDIRQYLAAGFAGGAWTGNGIVTSSGTAAIGLGYAESSAVLGAGGGSFGGQTVDGTAILIKYTWFGDTNLDGQVDVIDLGNLATAWQTNGVWSNGDSNYDGFVDVIDLGTLATNWQAGVGSPLGPGSLDQALAAYGLPSVSVPEPAAIAVLGMSLWALARRRRAVR